MQCCAVLADTTKLVSGNLPGNSVFDSKARTFSKFFLLGLKISIELWFYLFLGYRNVVK